MWPSSTMKSARSSPSWAAYSPGTSTRAAAARASWSRSASSSDAKIPMRPISSTVTTSQPYVERMASIGLTAAEEPHEPTPQRAHHQWNRPQRLRVLLDRRARGLSRPQAVSRRRWRRQRHLREHHRLPALLLQARGESLQQLARDALDHASAPKARELARDRQVRRHVDTGAVPIRDDLRVDLRPGTALAACVASLCVDDRAVPGLV